MPGPFDIGAIDWGAIKAGMGPAGIGAGMGGGVPTGIGGGVPAGLPPAYTPPSWLGGLPSAGIGAIGEAGGFRTTQPSWPSTAYAGALSGIPFGSLIGQALAPTPAETTAWTPAGRGGMAPWQTTPTPTPTPEPTPTPTPAGVLPAGVTYRIPEGAKVGDFFEYAGWVYRVDMDDWSNLFGTPLYAIESEPEGMSEYERAYLDFMQQQAATQEAARQREWLAGLAADPSRWIELSQYTTGEPGTVPEWLSGIYEGQVPAGAPLGEAREAGPAPLLSKQWWDWLSPAEREKLMGYMTWIGQEPEDWMSRMWWMRGQQPFGMGRQFAPFRQYG